MKKTKKILLMFLILFLNISLVSAESTLSFEQAQKMIKEVMDAYYNRRTAIQYNFSKATYGEQSPEEATSQDTKYDVCGAFVSDVYSEAFGIKHDSSKYGDGYTSSNLFTAFPKLNEHSIEAARVYLESYGGNSSALNGNFLIYYQKKDTSENGQDSNGIKYIYDIDEDDVYTESKVTASIIAKKLQPGDIVVYTGHVMMVYDLIKENDEIVDAKLINATSGPFNHDHDNNTTTNKVNALIPTRLSETDKLIYNIFSNNSGNPIWLKDNMPIWGSKTENGTPIFFTPTLGNDYKIVDDITSEGAVQWLKLSEIDELVNPSNQYFRCTKAECAIIRPFYKGSDNNVQFNYPSNNDKINKSRLRLKYPGLIIEKTVDKGDNNSVYVGDTLTYTIKIKNTSSETYSKFRVEEILDNQLSYIKSTIGTTIENTTSGGILEENRIYWEVDSLGANQTLTITLEVNVKNIINESSVGAVSLESKGNFYGYENETIDRSTSISTGTVKNDVLRRSSVTLTETYANCKESTATGLAYIDAVYNCVYDTNYDFSNNFDFSNLLVKRSNLKGKTSIRAIDILTNDGIDKTSVSNDKKTALKLYKKMILNNYWSGLNTYTNSNDEIILYLPAWLGGNYSGIDGDKQTHLRARTIRPQDFQNGDVLIYYVDPDNLDSNTKESGMYSYIYIDGDFIGKNNNDIIDVISNTTRDTFNYQYYSTIDGLSIHQNLYNANYTIYANYNSTLHKSMHREILDFANYQTLYGKDYYVILRPEKAMKAGIKFKEIDEDNIPKFLHGKEYSINEIKSNLGEIEFVQFYGDNSYETLSLVDEINDDKATVTLDTSEKGNQNLELTFDNQTATLNIKVIQNKYIVTFVSNGETLQETKEAIYDESYGELPTPTARDGYTFGGWYLEETYKTKVTEDTKVTNAESHTLYAKWTANKYTVTFVSNGETLQETKEVTFNSKYGELPTPSARDGYTFEGWYLEETYKTKVTEDTKVETATNHTLYAKWTANKYTVTFVSNGETLQETKEVTFNSKYGELPTPSARDGYTFEGWYLEETYKTKVTEDTKVETATNHTLYAKWTANKYTVTFVSNGETLQETKEVTFNSKYGELPTPSARDGYTFEGWYLEETYKTKVTEDTKVETATNHTLYAKWTANKYTATFVSNGETLQETKEVIYDESYGELPTPSAREGYTFEGWYLEETYKTKVTEDTKVETATNHTLYAKWTKNNEINKYTVIFVSNGETLQETKEVIYDESYGELPTPSARDGYTFEGWYLEETYKTKVTEDTKVTNAESHTLYAKWTANKYTVTFVSNGETLQETKEVTFNSKYGELPTPSSRDGYTFEGWYLEETYKTKVTEDTKVTNAESHTLYAKWTANKYTATFVSNGETLQETKEVIYDESYGELPTPSSREGYTFGGWYLEETYKTKVTEDTKVTNAESHTLYAKWTANKYTVTFVSNGETLQETKEVTFNSKYGELSTPTLREGYTFEGWYLEETYKTKLTEDTKVETATNHTLYAKWTANKYTVTFVSNGETLQETKEVTFNSKYGELSTPSAREGYTFEGWYLEETYKTKVTKDTKVTNAESHTLYAKWFITVNSYTLTINPEGGIYNGDLQVSLKNNETKQIDDPIRKGYIFRGWEINGKNSSIKNKIFTMGISNTTLRAKWELFIPNIEKTSAYKLNGTLIKNISLGTNLKNFNLGLSNIYNIKIHNKLLDEKTSGNLTTGDIMQIYLDDLLVSEYTAVVKGDVTGTGTATVSDVAKLYQYLKKKITIEDCYKEAGNVVDVDNEIKINDVAKLYQYIKGNINSL